MKKKINLLKTALFLLAIVSLASCNKKEELTVAVNNLWFPEDACVQELQLTSNCKWSISIDDNADWFTIDPMSGRNDETLSITVPALDDNAPRSSSFTITTDKGTAQVQVFVSQKTDTPLELQSITNLVFGVSYFAHWNVDYYGEVIEETYKRYEFNPADTSTGYQMFFLEDGIGYQKDNHGDSTVYWQFSYEYEPVSRILHLDFVVESDTAEIYDAPVLIATEELFRFQHEYKPMRWELADMRNIGTINPHEKSKFMQASKKRKNRGTIFQIDPQ